MARRTLEEKKRGLTSPGSPRLFFPCFPFFPWFILFSILGCGRCQRQVLRGVKNQEKNHEVHEEHEDGIRRSFHSRGVSSSDFFVVLTFDFFARRKEHCMRNSTICRKCLVSTDETNALKLHVYERQRRSAFTNANGVPDRSPGSRGLRAHPGLRPTYMTLPQRAKGPKGALQL